MQTPLGKILLRKEYSYDLKKAVLSGDYLIKQKACKTARKSLAGTRFGALQYDAMSKTSSPVLLKYVLTQSNDQETNR